MSWKLYWHQSDWLMRRISTAYEGSHELVVVVTGVVSIQPEVGPLHEDVGDILASGLVKNVVLECLKKKKFQGDDDS